MKKSLFQFITIIPLALLLCLSFSCQQQVEEGITEEEAKAFVDQDLEIWNEGNLAVVDEGYDPDYTRHYVDIFEDIVGIDAFKQWITDVRTAFPDFHITIEGEIIVKTDKIVSRRIGEGTNLGSFLGLPPTGKKVKFFGVNILHIVNGKVVEEWVYFNQASLLQQLGFTLTPPQPPESPEEKK
jgi:steroid delta-isomerase-like uncharacterized protein